MNIREAEEVMSVPDRTITRKAWMKDKFQMHLFRSVGEGRYVSEQERPGDNFGFSGGCEGPFSAHFSGLLNDDDQESIDACDWIELSPAQVAEWRAVLKAEYTYRGMSPTGPIG